MHLAAVSWSKLWGQLGAELVAPTCLNEGVWQGVWPAQCAWLQTVTSSVVLVPEQKPGIQQT